MHFLFEIPTDWRYERTAENNLDVRKLDFKTV